MQSSSQSSAGDNVKPSLVLLSTCLIAFLMALDVTIVNLALPSMQRDLGFSLKESSWVLNSYTLTFAVLVIVGGKLGDMFGRKRFLIIGASLFAAGSLIGFLSPNIQTLLAARVVQGLGGAMMMPASLSVLTEAYQHRNIGLAIGFWGGIGALGFVAGPLISGGFTSLFHWRVIFLLSLSVIVVAVSIIFLTVRESRDVTIDRRIDYLGVVLSAVTVLLLVMAIVEGTIYGWTSVETLLLFSGAALSTILFFIVEMRISYPIVDPRFFLNRAFAVGVAVRFCTGFAFVPVILMSTIFLQYFLHKSAFEAGFLFLPVGAAIVVATLFWGKIVDHYGPRVPMTLGMLIAGCAALTWLTFDASSTYVALLISLLLASFGGAATFVTTTAVVVNALGVNKAGVASGIVYMTQNVSAALGVALVSSVFLNSLRSELAEKAPMADYRIVESFGPEIGNAAQAEAFASALSNAGLVVAIVVFLGAAVAIFLPRAFTFSHSREAQSIPSVGA